MSQFSSAADMHPGAPKTVQGNAALMDKTSISWPDYPVKHIMDPENNPKSLSDSDNGGLFEGMKTTGGGGNSGAVVSPNPFGGLSAYQDPNAKVGKLPQHSGLDSIPLLDAEDARAIGPVLEKQHAHSYLGHHHLMEKGYEQKGKPSGGGEKDYSKVTRYVHPESNKEAFVSEEGFNTPMAKTSTRTREYPESTSLRPSGGPTHKDNPESKKFFEEHAHDESPFAHLEHKLAHKPGVTNPAGLAAKIGREKLGEKEMERRSIAGREK
jgi:hypothetical protein